MRRFESSHRHSWRVRSSRRWAPWRVSRLRPTRRLQALLPTTETDIAGSFDLVAFNESAASDYDAGDSADTVLQVQAERIVIAANNTWADTSTVNYVDLITGDSTAHSTLVSTGSAQISGGTIQFVTTIGQRRDFRRQREIRHALRGVRWRALDLRALTHRQRGHNVGDNTNGESLSRLPVRVRSCQVPTIADVSSSLNAAVRCSRRASGRCRCSDLGCTP